MSDKTTAPDRAPSDRQELTALIKRARSGDASTLPALRDLLLRPEAVEALGGDFARLAEASLIAAAGE